MKKHIVILALFISSSAFARIDGLKKLSPECNAEITKICPNMEKNENMMMRCVNENMSLLSQSCVAQISLFQAVKIREKDAINYKPMI